MYKSLSLNRIMKFQDSIEYRILPIPFTVLTLCGTWYPENWPANKKRIYSFVTMLLLVLGVILFIEITIKIILIRKTDEFKLENVFAAIVFAVGIYKKINILYFRPKLITFICDYSNNEWYQPQNFEEYMIHLRIQEETRWVSISYAIFILVSVLFRSVTPILESGTFVILPLDGWYPYSINNFFAFWLTYVHQIVSGVTLSCMHLSSDTLFVGLLLQINCQLNILKHRLRELGNLNRNNSYNKLKEDKLDQNNSIKAIITQRIREHENIYRFAGDLQETFKPLLMGQMVVVIPSLIINVYFLSVYTDRLNLKYCMTVFFTIVSLMQIYMFCWYGNEIVLGSIDIGNALYECNWMTLNQSTRKLLLTIIMRSSQSILISAVSAIPLNIDSFIKIMKTSYSAFNLLQQTATQY